MQRALDKPFRPIPNKNELDSGRRLQTDIGSIKAGEKMVEDLEKVWWKQNWAYG